MAKRGYLEPKVGAPDLVRKHRKGQFVNAPSYMEMGGFTSATKLNRSETIMALQKGALTNKGKPI